MERFRQAYTQLFDDINEEISFCNMILVKEKSENRVAYTTPLKDTLYIEVNFERERVYAFVNERPKYPNHYTFKYEDDKWMREDEVNNPCGQGTNVREVINPIISELYWMWDRNVIKNPRI